MRGLVDEAVLHYGLLAPHGTPPEIVDILSAVLLPGPRIKHFEIFEMVDIHGLVFQSLEP